MQETCRHLERSAGTGRTTAIQLAHLRVFEIRHERHAEWLAHDAWHYRRAAVADEDGREGYVSALELLDRELAVELMW